VPGWSLSRETITRNTRIGTSTAYSYLHEALDALAALAPDVHQTLLAAEAARATHLNPDGTLIHTDHVAMKCPNGADLWWRPDVRVTTVLQAGIRSSQPSRRASW
jgi:hypothetical protein